MVAKAEKQMDTAQTQETSKEYQQGLAILQQVIEDDFKDKTALAKAIDVENA